MSWGVSAVGKVKDVAPSIAKQIAGVKLNDLGEMETVKHVGALLEQALSTFDQEKPVKVMASGSMGFSEYTTKTGPYQSFSISVEPIHFTVSS